MKLFNMLLSEVLDIAKNISPLNESYKSNILTNILHKFDYSNITIEPYNPTHIRLYSVEGTDYYDLVFRYKNLAEHDKLTLDICDTMEGRYKIMLCKYRKIKKEISYGGRIEGNGITRIILNAIYDKIGYSLAFSDITDNDLIEITPDDAKKKTYKNGLLFWCDYNDNLTAVTIDNKIVLYIEKKDKYNSWYEPNPSYHEETDFSEFKYDRTAITDYVKKAFKVIPVYDIYIDHVDIKSKLKNDNIKFLQLSPNVQKVYVINQQGMEISNIQEKIYTREDYKKFIKSLMDLAAKNRERYKLIIKINKANKEESHIVNKTYEFMDLCMNAMDNLRSIELDMIMKGTENDFFTGSSSWSLLIPYNYIQYLTKTFGDNSLKIHRIKVKSYNTYDLVFSLLSIGDCFVIVNIRLLFLIDLSNKVIKLYNMYNEIKNSSSSTNLLIVDAINNLKTCYNNLKTQYNIDYQHELYCESVNFLKSKGIDIKNIFKDIDKFNWIK